MNKYKIFYFTLLVFCAHIIFAQCDISKKELSNAIYPALYDNHRTTLINTYDNPYEETYQVNLFKSVVYKLVFKTDLMPDSVSIKVYDIGDKKGHGKYKLLFDSKTGEKNDNGDFELTLKFPNKKVLIVYDVPENTKPGCVSFVLGYYFKNENKIKTKRKAKVKVN